MFYSWLSEAQLIKSLPKGGHFNPISIDGARLQLYFIFSVPDSESVRPFQCSFCGNRFITESVLKAHITRNHSVESQQAIESTKSKYYFHCVTIIKKIKGYHYVLC